MKENTIGLLKDAIGVFDSGIGGISVLKEIYKTMPDRDLIYFGDQIHVPYGPRSLDQVREFSVVISNFLISKGASIIVVACNAASAAALHHLRDHFPDTPFVGMEPAVKPAAKTTKSGKVGVLATPATFQGKLYASVVERFANDVELIQDTCPGLVQEIEKGQLRSKPIKLILEKALIPMLDKGIDTIVLGCTHYPFVIPVINEIVGDQVIVIDPAPSIALQTRKVAGSLQPNIGQLTHQLPWIITSGNLEGLKKNFKAFFPEKVKFSKADWLNNNTELNITQ
jgi:glutamate racemase